MSTTSDLYRLYFVVNLMVWVLQTLSSLAIATVDVAILKPMCCGRWR